MYMYIPTLSLSPPLTAIGSSIAYTDRLIHTALSLSLSLCNCAHMEDRKEKNSPWLSVPQFGDWDQNGPLPDYSMDFSKIRENRKQNKRDPSRASLGNEEEFVSKAPAPAKTTNADHHQHHYHQRHHSPTGRKSFFSYFNCCVKA